MTMISKSRGTNVSANTSRASRLGIARRRSLPEVGQRQEPHARLARDERGTARGRVLGLARAIGVVGDERRLVHEHVGAGRELDHGVARDRVAGQDHGAPGTCRADELLGRDGPAVGERHGLASQERAALRAVWHAELGRERRVEDTGASVLDEGPRDGVTAMPYRPGVRAGTRRAR